MSRFYGKVGFSVTEDKGYGVWKDTIVERSYYGDIYRMSARWQNTSGVNDNLLINNQVSIIADPFAFEHFSNAKYVIFGGSKWKVTNIEPAYPRITLTLGDLYNKEDTGGELHG